MPQRNYGQPARGGSFDAITISQVWNKGRIVPGIDPTQRRMDACGAWIDRKQYGATIKNGTGWEIDHITPVSRGGSDALNNLQPLQWENNREKSDKLPGQWSCAAVAAK